MRTYTNDSGLDLRLADAREIPEALGIMNSVMSLNLTADRWSWLRRSASCKPGWLMVAAKNEELSAVMTSYPKKINVGNGRIGQGLLSGQLCSKNTGGMRKRGAGVEALIWAEKKALQELGIPLMIGITGEKLYQVYYRKLLGYTRQSLNMKRYQFLDSKELAKRLAQRYVEIGLDFPGDIRVAFDDGTGVSFGLHIQGKGAGVVENSKDFLPHLRLRGQLWPLFRYLLENRARWALVQAVANRRLKVRGWFRHPICAVRLVKILLACRRTRAQ